MGILERVVTAGRGVGANLRSARQDQYELRVPSAATAVDAASVPWASKLPMPGVAAGDADLFDDPRIRWGLEQLGGVDGQRVLELGPLEGGHSAMAQAAGAAAVLAVEADRAAFLKCLIAKELLGLDRCHFVCGDAVAFLEDTEDQFDVCVASGILYHMTEPVRLLELITRRSSRLLLWTHVHGPAVLENRRLSRRLGPPETVTHAGITHTAHRHEYRSDGRFAQYCGGPRSYSTWLPREELVRVLGELGWRDITIGFDEPRHPNGPAIALTAVCG